MNSSMEKPYVVGIDIGGTNTVFGIVDARGTIIASGSIKTGAHDQADDYVDAVCKKDRKSTRLNSSHRCTSRMPSSA